MASTGKSLRQMVDHWLAPYEGERVKVAKFRNRRSTRERYVCIEASKPAGPVAMFFFRHDDGNWCIYPPRLEQPAMSLTPWSGSCTDAVA
ncbi:ABC-type transporter MlaC component [Paraburkholderia sp. 32]